MNPSHTKMPLLANKRVVIIGAGPSGLTLARLLQMQGASVQVFEADAAEDARNQGGTLDLHEDSGQLALQKAGLEDRFRSLCRPEGQTATVLDKQGTVHIQLGASDNVETRPEIDRGILRRLLLDSLSPGTVTWGRRLSGVECETGGGYGLFFEDGASATADVLFGCDGAWSKVRPLVSPTLPHYGGVTFIETRLTSPDTNAPEISQLVGPGSVMALGDNRALMAQRNGDGHIRVYVALRVPEDWGARSGLDFARPTETRAHLLKLFDGWAPHLRAMLEKSDDLFLPRPLFTLPPEQVWQHRPNVTLLGDAAHLMPPFTGRGANYAMLDAVELAGRLMLEKFADVSAAIRDYEITMLSRMADAIKDTLTSQDRMIAPDAPAGLVDFFNQRNRQMSA